MQSSCLTPIALFLLQVEPYILTEQAQGLRMLRHQLGAVSMVAPAAAVCDGFAMTGRIDKFAASLLSCVVVEAAAWGEAILCIWQQQDSALRAGQQPSPQHAWNAAELESLEHLHLNLNTQEEIAAKLEDERCSGASGWKAAGDALVDLVASVAQLAHQFGAVYALAGTCRHTRGREAILYTRSCCRVKGCVSTGASAMLCQLLAKLCQVAAATPAAPDGSEGVQAERRLLCGRFRLVVSAILQVRSLGWCSLSDRI